MDVSVDRPKFFTDVHIAKEAVQQLRRKGVDIIHCGDIGMREADDLDLLEYATHEYRVIVSCDEGFERYHAEYQTASREHGGIVYFRMTDQCKSVSILV